MWYGKPYHRQKVIDMNDTLRPTRRNLVRGAAWSVPVIAVAAQAPAFAVSPTLNNAINGWVTVSNPNDGSSRANWSLNGNRNQGSYQGTPYGLYVLGTNAADVISAAAIELDIAGNNNISWDPSGTSWDSVTRVGTIVRNEDGDGGLTAPVRFTRYRFQYTGGYTSITSGGVERKWLDDFIVTSGNYDPPSYNGSGDSNKGGLTIWMRRFVTVNGQQRFFERRQGDMGFLDYFGGGAGSAASRMAAGAKLHV